jgi:DNA-binding transcriptional ArsR family regulator
LSLTNREQGKNGRSAAGGKYDEAAEVLRALSHPIRLRIVALLAEGEFCVKRVEELMKISQSSASQHLSRLRYAGLIESERRGQQVCYRLADGRAERIRRLLVPDSEKKSGSTSPAE